MVKPNEIWWTGPAGSLSSEINGLTLAVSRAAVSGYVRFTVLENMGDMAIPARIRAMGIEQSAQQAMVSAEEAATAMKAGQPATRELAPAPVRSINSRSPACWPARRGLAMGVEDNFLFGRLMGDLAVGEAVSEPRRCMIFR